MVTETTEKLVLVTGASRGIGQAVAAQFAQRGAIVIGTATTEQGAASITDHLKSIDGKGEGCILNLTDKDNIVGLIEQIKEKYKRTPDILVNNAGVTHDNLLLRMKDDEWFDVINTNLTGVFFLTKQCLRGMLKAHWGRIISIGSAAGTMGNPGQTNYAAAKAGLIGFSKSLAIEVGSRGITVNVVAPGFVATDMTKDILAEQQEALLPQIPVGRVGTPDDIAAAVMFLASEEAGYITGDTLNVNGGLHMV